MPSGDAARREPGERQPDEEFAAVGDAFAAGLDAAAGAVMRSVAVQTLRSSAMVIRPPGGVYFTALPRRFETTCSSRSRSALT
jgi:hypothetical protein